jgi:hypothetical protein
LDHQKNQDVYLIDQPLAQSVASYPAMVDELVLAVATYQLAQRSH